MKKLLEGRFLGVGYYIKTILGIGLLVWGYYNSQHLSQEDLIQHTYMLAICIWVNALFFN